MHADLGEEPATALYQRGVEEFAHARRVVGDACLDQRLLEIRRPAFGTGAFSVRTTYRVLQSFAYFCVETMSRYRGMDVVIQRVTKLELLPEMAVRLRPGTPENIGLKLVRHVVRNRK